VTPTGNGSGRRGPGSSFGWVSGLILIVLGVVFMLQSAGIMVGNWWTIFIFIPALVSFYNAFRAWRKDGRFSAAASGSLTGGLLLSTVGTILALGLDWSKAWPAILIAIGLGLILGSLLGRGKE
jgi:hypothetical protein